MRLKLSVVAGAAINTNMAVTGIAVEDQILAAWAVQPPTATSGNTFATDLFAEINITSAGNVQCTTTNTTGNQVLVLWNDVS
jgi:hypothetical protein